MKGRRIKMFNDRPHPGPLPQERENRSRFCSKTRDWICPTLFRESGNARSLFPLLGGEGQGEGGRYH